MHLIEYRKLHRDQREIIELPLHLGPPPGMTEVEVDDAKPMAPVAGETQKDEDVGHVPTPFEGFHVVCVKSGLRSRAGKGSDTLSGLQKNAVNYSPLKVKFFRFIHTVGVFIQWFG
jgi:hypothetical protein